MNSINERLERLRAKLSGVKKNTYEELRAPPPSVPTPVAVTVLRHFRVQSGNVTVFITDQDQKAAAISFAKLMTKGPPFENSALSDLMQIKDLKSYRTWYAHTMSMLSAVAA